jgi:Na+-driven multidrug efflux pump
LISVFHWGIQGLALATIIALAVYTTVNCSYFLSGKSSIPVNPKKFALAIDLLPAVISVGISELLIQVMGIVQEVVIFKSIAHYGTDTDIAFAGATLRLYFLASLPVYGFVQALQPVIGMNYGAKNYDRLKKAYFTFTIGGTILLTLLWLPLQLSPETFLGWLLPNVTFTSNDLLNFKMANLLLPILPWGICSVTLFQSLGNAKSAGLLIILRSIFLVVPLVLFLSALLGIKGIYYGMALADFLVILIAVLLTWIEFKKLSVQKNNPNQIR